MINYKNLQECLNGLIGFKNSMDSEAPKVSSNLEKSESGLYINGEHSLITVQNIISSIEDGGNIELPSGVDGNEVLELYISDKIKQSVIDLASKIFLYKNLNDSSKSVLGDVTIFQGAGNIRDTIVSSGRFVGFKLNLKEEGLSTILSKIGLQLTHENPGFKIYIYHSSQLEPIEILPLDYNKSFSFQWINIANKILSYSGDHNDGGHFYIGYYEDDLIGQAIEKKIAIHNWSGCGSCDPINSNLFRKRSAYLSIHPIYVDSVDLQEDKSLWNDDKTHFVDNQNWGLNLQMSVMCDVTDIFCRNKYAIAKPLAKQVAVNILEDMAFGARDNQRFQKISQLAMYALEDRDNRSPGMKTELDKMVKALSFNLSGINQRCLPCDLQNESIEFGTIY